MNFEHLRYASRLVNGSSDPKMIFYDWDSKREQLILQLIDFPSLIEAYKNTRKEPYAENKEIVLVDKIPELRLRNACEATVNALYSMAEVSSHFANKVSGGQLPSNFHNLQKKADKGLLEQPLIDALGDLQWYRKVREIRTEWVHYSTIFIGKNNDEEPLLIVKAYRRPSDKQEFPEKHEYLFPDIVDWVKKSISTIDAYGVYLLEKYVLPSLNPDNKVRTPIYDRNGWPIIRNGLMENEEVTVRELMRRCGIEI